MLETTVVLASGWTLMPISFQRELTAVVSGWSRGCRHLVSITAAQIHVSMHLLCIFGLWNWQCCCRKSLKSVDCAADKGLWFMKSPLLRSTCLDKEWARGGIQTISQENKCKMKKRDERKRGGEKIKGKNDRGSWQCCEEVRRWSEAETEGGSNPCEAASQYLWIIDK